MNPGPMSYHEMRSDPRPGTPIVVWVGHSQTWIPAIMIGCKPAPAAIGSWTIYTVLTFTGLMYVNNAVCSPCLEDCSGL